jgi:hypothetical protein
LHGPYRLDSRGHTRLRVVLVFKPNLGADFVGPLSYLSMPHDVTRWGAVYLTHLAPM